MLFALLGLGAPSAGQAPVVTLEVDGIIDPVVARYVDRGVSAAEGMDAGLVVLALDTPGGLDQSMRAITRRLVNARVPVAVYVSPAGARAASAGAFISLAAHLLAMAPGTTIGAAHPVDLQGKSASEKITNDAAAYLQSLARLRGKSQAWAERAVRRSLASTAEQALQANVADMISPDLKSLLAGLDGRSVDLPSGKKILQVKDAPLRDLPMTFFENFLHALSNPNVTYILFLVGLYGLIYELAAPGLILPGVAGAISLLLALMGMEALPISLTGILLLALGAGLLILELFVISHGILAVGGLLALLLGSLMLFPGTSPSFRVSHGLIAGMLSLSAAYIFLIIWVALRARKAKALTGVESLAGAHGRVKALTPEGALVHVQGEDWLATPDSGPLAVGQDVEVEAISGLKLKVKSAAGRDL